MSMIKVTYSSDISSTVGVGGEIVKSASETVKQASTIFNCDYDALKPPKGMTGIHLVALGDSEAYPMNRNGDLFTKKACQKYHDTFVKYGHVFEHHRNKDPKKAIGEIKAAAYNPDMHRVELYIWADNEKAHDHLERLEKTGEVSFSMACLRAGAPVLTIDGYRPIEDIDVGDVVFTHLGRWKRVNATMSRDADEYCEVTFVPWKDKTLEITPNHQVLAVSFDDVPRASRKDNSERHDRSSRRLNRDELPKYMRWVQAGDLTDRHYMCVPDPGNALGGIGENTAGRYGCDISDGYMLVPVAGVKTVRKSTKVYNMSVDDDESYTVFGLAVHNCTVKSDRCSVCNAIRERPGDPGECDHIKYSLGKIAEDGTQIGTYNDEPKWFDISFVGRPADRIAWNLKVASAMPEELVYNSVKRAEVEGYVLPDAIAIESDSAKRKLGIMRKLADAYSKFESWSSGETRPAGRDRYVYELRKLAGARIGDDAISALREMDPACAFAALGDAGVVMDAPSFFKYAFGPDYGAVAKYVPAVEKFASEVVREAVDTSSCAEFCNCSRFDPERRGAFSRPVPSSVSGMLSKSAAARGFGTDDAVSRVLEAVASGEAPAFRAKCQAKEASAGEDFVARKLARKYAMYKVAALCAVMEGKEGCSLNEDDVVFVAAAQDERTE